MEYLRSLYASLPSKPGVYLFLDKKGDILYVGKAKDLKARVSSYFVNASLLGEKTRILVSQIEKIKITIVESEVESLLLEAFYIKKYLPKYNIRLTDDKSYPLIKITVRDTYPVILFARRMDDPNSSYFGPYPSAGSVKLVLKILRRAFPYQSVQNHPKRICLYNHLGLCPCPPVYDSDELRRTYRKNIHNIIRILEGKSKSVLQDLQKEMERKSKEEQYEEAEVLRRQTNALLVITQPFIKPFEYDVNPNLRIDLRSKELLGLLSALSDTGLQLQNLHRIECYDISNIQGTNATGSMVVLTDGEIDKSQYRKFKIKKDGKPNDFAMMQEMLERRLKHTEWGIPDLIIVDGGKGQLTSVLAAMQQTKMHYPVVGLAKREETLILPTLQRFFDASKRKKIEQERLKLYGNNEENFIEITLPKHSSSLHLIERIRNEAHRFAITYHQKLRSRGQLN